MQVLSGSFSILFSWLGDAQHPPQQILDSLSQLIPLNPYCTGGFCTQQLSSTILHQWGFKVNKLVNFTRSGIGTLPNLSQLVLFWTAWRGEGTSVPNFVLLSMFLISLGYLWLKEVMYCIFSSAVQLLLRTYPDFSGGRLPEVKTRSNKTLVLLSSLKIERKKITLSKVY